MQQKAQTQAFHSTLCHGKAGFAGLVWFGKCTRQKGFFDQQNVQRRKEDYWKIAFQNQHGEIRQNGRIDHLHVFPWWRTNAYKQ